MIVSTSSEAESFEECMVTLTLLRYGCRYIHRKILGSQGRYRGNVSAAPYPVYSYPLSRMLMWKMMQQINPLEEEAATFYVLSILCASFHGTQGQHLRGSGCIEMERDRPL